MNRTTDTRGCAFSRIQTQANEAAPGLNSRPHPTPAQAEARNYKLGRTVIHGLKVAIENPRGSTRSGTSKDGKTWSNRMAAHYGEFTGTRGADGDAVDVFVGDFPESTSVWVINQKDAKGGFDEHKVMLGFHSLEQARDAYRFSFDRDWRGLGAIVPASLSQLKWWLRHGDMKRPLTADQLPPTESEEGKPIMDRVLWNPDATPAYTTVAKALYDIRAHDGSDGLVFDAVSMDDIMSDPDITGRVELDALVVEVGRMQQKMDQVLRVMKAASATVQPVDLAISDPVKSRGVLQVAVLFNMDDGQTITVWFHNPDTTPAKLTPMDELISWKWMLNKKDVTIVVAPEFGRDLNVREVARRIMKLVEKNSEGFKRANGKATERAAMIEGLKGEITALQVESVELDGKLAQAEAAAVERERVAALPVEPAWRNLTDGELASEEGYAKVEAGGEQALLAYQDFYDHLFQNRYIDMRNALRERGWDGPNFGDLSKDGYVLEPHFKQVGAGRNIVGVHYTIKGATGFFMSETLRRTPLEMAEAIDRGVTSRGGRGADAPAGQAARVSIAGDEFGAFSDDKAGLSGLRAVAKAAYEAVLGAMVPCPALGVDVELRRSGMNKVMSMSADPRKLKILAKIKEVIGSGKKLGSRPPYNPATDASARAYHTLRAEVDLAGEVLAVRLVVKEDVNGAFHYDHTVHASDAIFDDTKANGPAQADPSTTSTSNGQGMDPSDIAAGEREGIVTDDASGVNLAQIVNLFIEGEPSEAASVDEFELPAGTFKTASEDALRLLSVNSRAKAIQSAFRTAKRIEDDAATASLTVAWSVVESAPAEILDDALFPEIGAGGVLLGKIEGAGVGHLGDVYVRGDGLAMFVMNRENDHVDNDLGDRVGGVINSFNGKWGHDVSEAMRWMAETMDVEGEVSLVGLDLTKWEGWSAGVERLLSREGEYEDAGGMILARTMSLKKAFEAGKTVRQGFQMAQDDVTDPDDLAYPRMSMMASDLADILRREGFGAYNAARSKMAAQAGYNANQELTVSKLVEERVGKKRMDLERAKFDPETQGQKANHRGDAPMPPEGLSREQAALWLKGYNGDEPAPEPDEIDHNGTRIYRTKVKMGDAVVDRWAVQSAENKARAAAGERTIGGDSLHQTLEEAKRAADEQAKRAADQAERDAELQAQEEARAAEKAARSAATSGMSLAEIKAADHLAGMTKDGETGEVVTRAEWVKRRVDAGDKPTIEMVNKIKPMSRLAFNRASNAEQRAHEQKVAAGGKIPQYWLGEFSVNKTEHDYAVKLIEQAGQASTPAAAPAAPASANPANLSDAEMVVLLVSAAYKPFARLQAAISETKTNRFSLVEDGISEADYIDARDKLNIAGVYLSRSALTKAGKDLADAFMPGLSGDIKLRHFAGKFAAAGQGAGAVDYKGFERKDAGGGAFTLTDGNLLVKVERTGADKFQASIGSAKSSPHLQGEQGAVDWAVAYRAEALRVAASDGAKVATALDISDVLEGLGFESKGSLYWVKRIDGLPGLFGAQYSGGWINLTARGEAIGEVEIDGKATIDEVSAKIRAALDSFDVGDGSTGGPAWEEKVRAAARAGSKINAISYNTSMPKAEREGMPVATMTGADGETLFLNTNEDVDRARQIIDDELEFQYVEFDATIVKMPSAAQLGLSKAPNWLVLADEAGEPTPPGWSNGHIIDLVTRPAVVQKAADKLGGIGRIGRRVTPESSGRIVSGAVRSATAIVKPVGMSPDGKVIVLASDDGRAINRVNAFYYSYFAKTHKGAVFYANPTETQQPTALAVKKGGEVVGVMQPMRDKDRNRTLASARRGSAPAPTAVVPNLIAEVDAAYKFGQATDRFKEYVADTVAEPDYSMFATAKAMDEAAKALGASISWDVDDVVLDSVSDEPQEPGLFDSVDPEDDDGEDFDPEAEFDACPAMGEQDE